MNKFGFESIKETNAEWIWVDITGREVNQYVEFRHEFILQDSCFNNARLLICVDSNYAAWINGTFINCGQYHDYPWHKFYDVLDIGEYLKPGENVLCILAYYQGISTMQYVKGFPGLMYFLNAGKESFTSGNQVYCRQSQCYRNGNIEMITVQLGFTFEYHADKCDSWICEKYKMDDSWNVARINYLYNGSKKPVLYERPVKKLIPKESCQAKIISQGVFLRSNKCENVAELMQSDLLYPESFEDFVVGSYENKVPSPRGIEVNSSFFENGQGVFFIIDLNREEAGVLELDMDTDEGTIVDISYGEHLTDLQVRSSIGGRNFACRYVCSRGRQKFNYYFKRFGCRYIELHISGLGKKFILHYAGIMPHEYPIEYRGSFECNNDLFNEIFKVSRRTLELCMHEHYEDCPWREQALYSMDSRNQALCGYYCFGEYDFPQASFELLGLGLQDDGFINLCAPSEFPITIPSFSLAWILETAEHLLYSGRNDVTELQYTRIKKMLEIYIKALKDDLLLCPQGTKFWHFYEWAEGMYDDFPDLNKINGLRNLQGDVSIDAPLNFFLILALNSAAFIAEQCEDYNNAGLYRLISEKVKNAVNRVFWNDSKKLYINNLRPVEGNNYSELTQALALYSNTCYGESAVDLRRKLSLKENGLVKCTLSHSIFKYEALLQEPEKYAKTVFDLISDDWGYMLQKGATSFWETIKGASDFDGAGSLCHGWSAIPVYFYQAYILGIKPEKPGFKSFSFHPVFNVCDNACGKIPTPFGNINISWEKVINVITFRVDYPKELIMV